MSSSDHYNSLSYSEEDDIQDDSYSDQSYNETRKPVSKATKPKATMKRKSTGVPKKPGRKPISNVSDEELLKDPKAKRRVQNREAQRNFR
ncbi:hypothetical protein DM01DRAFT_27077 [Hesseltinella vesiculosa]|uniref:BZIP domain-containing protein n=1 Tax=Hesseltinella vesiculosa TaxID=101127 RepID=A0A1X2GHW8_9FUNG|nr:hypothetical protein DM01DRAFT_27077 [Hesseltinella vesiculosa]